MTRAVIFDLDGTLVDTEPMYWAAWRRVLAQHDVDLTDAHLHANVGRTPIEGARKYVSQFTLTVEPSSLVDGLIAEALAIPEREMMNGALRTLELVRAAGLSVAIATGGTMTMANASLKGAGLAEYFDVVVSAEHESHGKPHPAVFLTAADRLGVHPTDCTVMEDAPNGIIAAKAARMRCIAVPEQYNKQHRTLAIADVVLESLEDFTLDLLDNRPVQ
jgi:HAD superfamily hydrolase (TIGR01509 family)